MKNPSTTHWATLSELSSHQLLVIMRARQEVFILEQQCLYLDADHYDEVAYHGIVWDHTNADGEAPRIAAYLRVLPPKTKYDQYASFGRVLTTAPSRGIGMGKRLIEEAVLFIQERFDNPPIKISAQSYLQRFYGGFAFEVSSESYLDAGIEHVDMIRRPRDR
jgi:ElaA protein